MKLEYTHHLSHPRSRVSEVLVDPEVLSKALAGIEKFEALGDDRFAMMMTLGVAAVKGTYSGTLEFADKQLPSSFRVRGEAKGAPGEVLVTLAEQNGGTTVTANVNVQIGGTIADVGQRMIEGITKTMARDFFHSIEQILEQP